MSFCGRQVSRVNTLPKAALNLIIARAAGAGATR
jgi:hypothetical protein